jgi:hypothetical protein
MEPRAIVEDGVVVGWMFAPEESDQADVSTFDGWKQMGYMSDG